MAVDHGADGIRVNCILPGPVYTPMVYSSGMTKQHRSQRQNASLIKMEEMVGILEKLLCIYLQVGQDMLQAI